MKRELRAILAADVVGYSRLMEADEEGTVKRQRQHLAETVRPAIEAHDGRIVKLMGDGILIEFPSVVGAVACAVEIQTRTARREAGVPRDRRIEYRVGINLGDVIHEDDDVFGDAVNIAARLEELAEPGGICVSGTAYDHLKSNIPVAYQPMGEVTVKNISQPVRVYKVLLDAADGEDARARPAAPRRWIRPAAMLAVLPVVAGAAWWALAPLTGTGPGTPDPADSALLPEALPDDRPSIAVLPFDNMSGGEDQDYFSDGMTEDLITDLSQVSGMFVLARNTVFTYKGKAVNVQQVGRELGVNYVLEGSVRRAGDRVRINAQLIDVTTGGHIWADRFDREVADVFAVQDDVVKRIVDALEVSLQGDEETRLSRTDRINPEAYDALLRGLEKLRRFTLETNLEARAYFERAVQLEPTFARALADLALTYSLEAEQNWGDDAPAAAKRGLELALKAEEMDPDLSQVQFVLTVAYRNKGMWDESLAAARRTVELDPNYADGYATLGISLNFSGYPEEALTAVRRATELNPLKPFFYVWTEGQSHYLLGNYDEAARLLEQVVESNPHFPLGHKLLAAIYVELDRIDDARWAVEELKTISTGVSLETERDRTFYADSEVTERYLDALRRAGIE